MRTELQALRDAITRYLHDGGLFNPELANHYRVSDLLTDIRIKLDHLLVSAEETPQEQEKGWQSVIERIESALGVLERMGVEDGATLGDIQRRLHVSAGHGMGLRDVRYDLKAALREAASHAPARQEGT